MRRLSLCLFFIIIVIVCYSAESNGQTYYSLGISDMSLGRFAGWPKAGFESDFYEGDLINNVYPDHIEKSHKDLNRTWKLWFGTSNTDINRKYFDHDLTVLPDANPDIWPEKQNWIYKKFAVVRYDTLQNVSVAMTDGGTPENIAYSAREGYTYTVSVNSVSPGTRIQTKHTQFYIENYYPDNVDVNHGLGWSDPL